MTLRSCIAGAAATALLVFGSAVFAQGSTSGPATGTNVEPSTATQKQNAANPPQAGSQGAGQGSGGAATGGAVSAGAPGASAQPGTEGGPAPQRGASQPR